MHVMDCFGGLNKGCRGIESCTLRDIRVTNLGCRCIKSCTADEVGVTYLGYKITGIWPLG